MFSRDACVMERIVTGLKRVWLFALIIYLFSACSKPQPSVDKLGKIVETDFFKNDNPLISIHYDSCGNNYIVGADSGFVYFIQNRKGKLHLTRKINCLPDTSKNISRKGIVIYSSSVEYKKNGDTIIWVGLRNYGLQKFVLNGKLEHQKTFIIKKKESNYSPYDIQGSEDTFWVASSNGLYLSNSLNDTLKLLYSPDYKAGTEPREFRVFNILKTENSGYFASSKGGLIHLNTEKSNPEIIIPKQVNYIFKKSKGDTIYALVSRNSANTKAFMCGKCVVLPIQAGGNPMSLYVDDNYRRWIFHTKSIEIQGKHPYKSHLSKYTRHPFVVTDKQVLFFGDEQFRLGLKNDNFDGTGTELENIAVDPVDQSFYAQDSNGGIYRSVRNSSKVTKFAQLKNPTEYVGMVAYNGKLFLVSSNAVYRFSKFDEVFSYQMTPRAFFSQDGIINCFSQDGKRLLLGTRKGIEELNLVEGYSKKLIDSVYIDHIQRIGADTFLYNILTKSEPKYNKLTETGIRNKNDWRILINTNELKVKDLNDTTLTIMNASPDAIYLNNSYYTFRNNSIEIISEKNFKKTCINGIADINPDQKIAQDGQKIYFIARNGGAFRFDTKTNRVEWLSFVDDYVYFLKVIVIVVLLLICMVALSLWWAKSIGESQKRRKDLTYEFDELIIAFKGSVYIYEIEKELKHLISRSFLTNEYLDKVAIYVNGMKGFLLEITNLRLKIKERMGQLSVELTDKLRSDIEQKLTSFDRDELNEIAAKLDTLKQKEFTDREMKDRQNLKDKIAGQISKLQKIEYFESGDLVKNSEKALDNFLFEDLEAIDRKNSRLIELHESLLLRRKNVLQEFETCFKTQEIMRLKSGLKSSFGDFRCIEELETLVASAEKLVKRMNTEPMSQTLVYKLEDLLRQTSKLTNESDRAIITGEIDLLLSDRSVKEITASRKILEISRLISQSKNLSEIAVSLQKEFVIKRSFKSNHHDFLDHLSQKEIERLTKLVKHETKSQSNAGDAIPRKNEGKIGNPYTIEFQVLTCFLSTGYLVEPKRVAELTNAGSTTVSSRKWELKQNLLNLTQKDLDQFESAIIKQRITQLQQSFKNETKEKTRPRPSAKS